MPDLEWQVLEPLLPPAVRAAATVACADLNFTRLDLGPGPGLGLGPDSTSSVLSPLPQRGETLAPTRPVRRPTEAVPSVRVTGATRDW